MRYIYLHGFASSRRSRKATAFELAFAERGHLLEIPELDGGAFERLTISGQLRVVEDLVGDEPCMMVGSSMGGYLAAIYAAGHASVERLVLLAPAFGLAGRWADLVGPEKMAEWKKRGELPIFHYGTQTFRKVQYPLVLDSQRYPDFPATRQPTLIFHGLSDVVVPVSLSRVFAAGHAEARLRELNSDHELLDVLDTVLLQAVPFALDELP